jgi:CDP-6-deoxy-D-xylo-4-hexulose-3-dehydrase
MNQEIKNLVKKIRAENAEKKGPWIAGKHFVPYAGTYYSDDEFVAAIESLLSEWIVLGNDGLKMERKFPEQLGKTNGVLTNSGSSANLLMMSALKSKRLTNLPKGTKVLTPVSGFPTTINPIMQVGFVPVFVDIEIDTLNLDLDKVESALKNHKDIKVITFAHVLGNPPDMDRLMDLVKRYDLILLEDCCDALGSTYDNKLLGSFGMMASCSFYPAHHMTMGEGGFTACSDSLQEDVLRSFREWGRGCYCAGLEANKLKNGTCKKRFSEWIPCLPGEIFDHKYVYDEIGYNLKPIELQASIGLQQMKKLPEIFERRRQNYKSLFNIYSKYEEFFYLPRPTAKSDPSWFSFPLTVKKTSPFTRTQIVDHLENNLIQTRPYFAGNVLLQPAYSHLDDPITVKHKFPTATYTMLNTYFHGTSPVITQEQIDFIGNCVDSFLTKYI